MSAVPPGGGADDDGGNGNEPPDDDDKVGYKHAPKKHRWPPGQSGNPGGRKKGAIGIKRALSEELGSKIRLTIERKGSRKTVSLSKLQYVVKLLVDKAVAGDRRAIEQLITLNITIFGLGDDESSPEAQLTPGEQALLDAWDHRASSGDAEAGHEADPAAVAVDNTDDDDA